MFVSLVNDVTEDCLGTKQNKIMSPVNDVTKDHGGLF